MDSRSSSPSRWRPRPACGRRSRVPGIDGRQRRRAKADAAARKHAHADLSAYRELVDAGPTEFTGFNELTRRPESSASSSTEGPWWRTRTVAIARTRVGPYTALRRSGGQLADVGIISGTGSGESARAAVTDVQKIAKALRCTGSTWSPGSSRGRHRRGGGGRGLAQGRRPGAFGHSHGAAALRQVLGPNAVQAVR